MNPPPDWKQLAESIAEQDEKLEALVITNQLWVINDVIVPAMTKGFPPNTTYHFGRRRFTLANGSTVMLQSIGSRAGVEQLRGLQFDLIFFDPNWDGPAEWMEEIRAYHRRPYARR